MILTGDNTLNVVQVPRHLFSATGHKGRRIFIECFGPTDKVQAQKDALVLSHIMTGRFYSKKSKEDRPIIRPVTVNEQKDTD